MAIIRGNHDKVAAGLASSRRLQPHGPAVGRVDTRGADARDRGTTSPRSREGPAVRRRPGRDLPRVARWTRTRTSSANSDAADALLTARMPLCLFGHTHLPAAAALDSRRSMEVLFRGAREDQRDLVRGRPALPGEPGIGGPAARRRPEGRLRAARHRRRWKSASAGWSTRWSGRRDRILAAGLPKALGNRLLDRPLDGVRGRQLLRPCVRFSRSSRFFSSTA